MDNQDDTDQSFTSTTPPAEAVNDQPAEAIAEPTSEPAQPAEPIEIMEPIPAPVSVEAAPPPPPSLPSLPKIDLGALWEHWRYRLALALIIIIAGVLHLHRLDWNLGAWPHPDERAVISQTYDMMVEDHYRPTIHSWGHFGYYLVLFSYKTYLFMQHWFNGIPVTVPLTSETVNQQTGNLGLVPHFRDLVTSGSIIPVGIIRTLMFCLALLVIRWICRRRLLAWGCVLLGLALLGLLYPSISEDMLIPTRPNYEDVAYMGRFFSAMSVMLSLPILYLLGKRLYSRRVGLLAAAFLAFTVLGIQLGHFYTVDVIQAFNALVALYAAALIITIRPNPTALQREPPPNDSRWEGTRLPYMLRYVLRVHHTIGWFPLAMYAVLGVFIGLSMGSKFSSAPLFVLPVIAHVMLLFRTRGARQLGAHLALAGCYVLALGTWYYVQPYAWENPYTGYYQAANLPSLGERALHTLFSQEFARSINEQSMMVKMKGGGPWVQQFSHTVPYLTVTMQMIRWSFGWPLGLVCVGAFFLAMVRNLFRPRAADLLLLSWVGVVFLITGQFKATFPRYTMGLIPPLCLLGAELCAGIPFHGVLSARWLERLYQGWLRLRAPVTLVVLCCALAYAWGFQSIYAPLHNWAAASLWIFKNAPPRDSQGRQTMIIHESWDDTIPYNLPFLQGINYGEIRMDLYSEDTEPKLRQMANQLAQGDWICLPTPRLYSTTMLNPDKYPFTARYYKLLFAGQLGYTLVKTVEQPPRFMGYPLLDQFADESTYVYDHPKCVIFQKTAPLSAQELLNRISAPSPEFDQLTRRDIMLAHEDRRQQLFNTVRDVELDETVVAEPELAKLVQSWPCFSDKDRARFVEQARAQLSPAPACSTMALADLLRAHADASPESLGQLWSGMSALKPAAGYRIGDLVQLAKRFGFETRNRQEIYDKQQELTQRLRLVTSTELVSTAVVREQLAAIRDYPLGASAKTAAPTAQAPQPRFTVNPTQDTLGRQIWAVIAWLLAIQLMAFAVLPLVCRMFAPFLDMGYPLSKTLGLVLVTFVVWAASNAGLCYFTQPTILICMALTAAACWTLNPIRPVMQFLKVKWLTVVWTEALFLEIFLVFLIIRLYNPEVTWGEKCMDFTFMNALTRTVEFPPYEPWFSGTPLSYYYYGYVLLAMVTKLTSVPTSYGFNIAISLIPALSAITAFSLLYNMTRRYGIGLLGLVLVCLAGNLDPTYQMFLAAPGEHGQPPLDERFTHAVDGAYLAESGPVGGVLKSGAELVNVSAQFLWNLAKGTFNGDFLFKSPRRHMWDSFWDSSRATGPGMINEYPLWSYLFADLHAHVLVGPLTLAFIACVYLLFRLPKTWLGGFHSGWGGATGLLFIAILLGSITATNIWDCMSCAFLLALMLLIKSVCLATHTAEPLVEPGVQGLDDDSGPGRPAWAPFREWDVPAWETTLAGLVITLFFFLAFWPSLCELHPYWLGCINSHAAGLVVALAAILLAALQPVVLSLGRWLAGLVWQGMFSGFAPLALIVGLSLVLFAPFHAHLQTIDATIKINNDGNLLLSHIVRHFGLFLGVMIAFAAWAVFGGRGVKAPERGPTSLSTMALFGVIVIGLSVYFGIEEMWALKPAMALYGVLIGAMAFTVLVFRRNRDAAFAAGLLLAGAVIAYGSEMVVVIDRMNTVFKLYHHVWVLFALGCAYALHAIFHLRQEDWSLDGWRYLAGMIARWVGVAVFMVVMGLVLICSWRGVVGVVTLDRISKTLLNGKPHEPTLNGMAYLEADKESSKLLEALAWLNAHAQGHPVLLEAFTDQGYDGSTRVTANTGLPTLLGWPHHTKQRGHTDIELRQRQQDIRAIYTSTDDAVVKKLLEDYHISYIFVGDFEHKLYGPVNREFEKLLLARCVNAEKTEPAEGTKFLRLAFSNEGNKIFEVTPAPPR